MRPTSQSASGPDGQTSRTCLEVSKQLCWGPGERSVLGVLPDLELSLPEGGQARGRTDVTTALPKAMLAPVRPSSNQSRNSTPSSPRSASQIRAWKSGSMWGSQPAAYSTPQHTQHSHLPPPVQNPRASIPCQHKDAALYSLPSRTDKNNSVRLKYPCEPSRSRA